MDYKKLNIHNGSEAQNFSSQRFFGRINDEQWLRTVSDLKKYCENDVRAMVAVEYFIKHLLKTKTI
jgi:hypothetical protein